jgi:hypothetical protein
MNIRYAYNALQLIGRVIAVEQSNVVAPEQGKRVLGIALGHGPGAVGGLV